MELRTRVRAVFGGGEMGDVRYYHTDAIGSVRMITDGSQAIVSRCDYLPFGEESQCTGEDPRRFAAYEKDPETASGSWQALNYAGARYYHAQTARFTSADPLMLIERSVTDPQSWNRYSYTPNNPLRYVDPDGRAFVLALVPLVWNRLHCCDRSHRGAAVGGLLGAVTNWFATKNAEGSATDRQTPTVRGEPRQLKDGKEAHKNALISGPPAEVREADNWAIRAVQSIRPSLH